MYGRRRSILEKITLMIEFSTGRNFVEASGEMPMSGGWWRASTVTEEDNGLMFVGVEALLLAFTLVFNLVSLCLFAVALGLPPGLPLLAPLLTLGWCPKSDLSPAFVLDEREWLFMAVCCGQGLS